MQSLSLKIILNDGAVRRVIKFPARATAADACRLVQERVLTGENGKDFGLFLPSADDDLSGIWLDEGQQLTHYLLRDGDSLHYRSKVRTLRMRTLDGAVKTMQVDESQPVQSLMMTICARLGITNYEEYGLRREDEPEEVVKPTTGTLTLKRKPKTREKDPAMDQLSKKLKTDDNVQWLEQHKTLRENAVPLEETLLLQRRLFYSDRKVDARDPVQLGLLYAQERDALLAGRHHVTEARDPTSCSFRATLPLRGQSSRRRPGARTHDLTDFSYETHILVESMPLPFNKALDLKLLALVKENAILYNTKHPRYLDFDAREVVWQKIGDALNRSAVEFAGIQCQVQFGDHQEDKHKPGFIEDLKDFLPENYASSRGIEKKILREHKKHAGLSEIEAKFVYTKSVRDLPTYGVTFFLVKEILQGKKKLVPRLLGISAQSVLRMDETTKDILNEWPLTQIKTYKAGKGELFTLNFGEYRDKEYCVKTNDAYRIRDILQAYIDLIRKKMAAPFNATADDEGAIYSASVESSKGTVMEVVSHSANKAVETSFVGPSRIISYEHGSSAQTQGAQIMTAQQVLVMSRQHNQHAAVAGGAARRAARDTAAGAARRLNHLNGLAVKIVELLTEPHSGNVDEAKKIIQSIEEGMPSLVEGVQECIETQPDEAARKKLTLEFNELQDIVAELARFQSAGAAREAAMRAADVSAQVYFALDLRARRTSELLRRSRNSFIEDERTHATLQRASLINTVALASEAIDDAKDILDHNYEGTALTPKEAEAVDRSARDKLAKLNAAIALFTHAHSDPKNIDYAAAVNALNTIKELLPELAKDVQALGTAEGETDRGGQARALRELCDAARRVCACAGCDDPEKLHDAANDYAKKLKPLLFTFSRGENPEKEREILSLAKEADEKARLLLSTAECLANVGDSDAAETLRAAARRCGDAARGLRACARLTAPSIHEPHCRSALTAASEDLASSAQAFSTACRPVLERPEGHEHSDTVKQQTADLLKALVRLNGACGDLDADNADQGERERRRLRFTNTAAKTLEILDDCDTMLHDERAVAAPEGWIGDTLPRRLAALGAAVAALVGATKDVENPDYAEAEAATTALQRHLPGFFNDAIWYSRSLPAARRAELAVELGALAGAARALAADAQDADAVTEFAKSSGKLTYVFDRRAAPDREHEIIDLTKACCERTSELLSDVYGVVDAAGGALADALDAAGTSAAEAAETLLTTAALTVPTVHIPPSRHALHASALRLSHELGQLAHAWAAADPALAQTLEAAKGVADDEIQKLLEALNKISADDHEELKEDPVKQKKRVRFALSLSQTGDAVEKAEKEIDKPVTSQSLIAEQAQAARLSLADKLAELNAAIASLAAATQDRLNPDFEAAEKATVAIQQLLPQVVEETKALASDKDEAARRRLLDDLRELCAATKELSSEVDNAPSSDAVARYARAAGRLTFVCTPRDARAHGKEKQVLAQSSAACERSQALLARAHELRAAPAPARAAARAAAALARAAQLTSSSLRAPSCRSELLRAASELSSAIAQLDAACGQPGQASALAEYRQAFDQAVEELMKTIRSLDDTQEAEAIPPEQEKRRLKFVATRDATQNALDNGAKDLAKPGKSAPLTPPQMNTMQLSLSDRLATLNAAIAALLAATRDPEKPDYEAAESASATVQELIPDLVKDAKTLSSGKDAAARDSLLDNLRALCEATRAFNSGESIGKEQEQHDTVKKFIAASGQLVYVFNPRADSAKEGQIIELSKSVCERTSELLGQVHSAAAAGGAEGGRLDARGAAAADAARALLTAAELTAPSIWSPLCQSSLLTAADGLHSSLEQLALAWRGAAGLDEAKAGVDGELARLREAVRRGHTGDAATEAKRERLRFTNSLASTKAALDAAERTLDEPASPSASAPASSHSLAERLAALNAATRALLAATRDPAKQDYAMAETASTTVRELVPDIVKDAKALSSKDPASREELLRQLRALCAAARALGAGAARGSPQELNEAVAQFSLASGKLYYVFRPHLDRRRADQIIESCEAAHERTSKLLQGVHLASERQQHHALDREMAVAADAADALLSTAQLTAHTVHSAPCQSALLEAADTLQSSVRALQAAWSPLVKSPEFESHGVQLQKDHQAVEVEIQRVKDLARDSGKDIKAKPAVPVRSGSSKAVAGKASAIADTKQFLDVLRSEASEVNNGQMKSLARVEEEKRAKSFAESVEAARTSIRTAQDGLTKYIKSKSNPLASLDDAQMYALNKQMEQTLARANAAAARLLACRSAETSDYVVASECVNTISNLLPTIAADATALSDMKDAKARESFLNDTLGLCAASVELCDAANNDKKNLTEAALSYGDQSSKLLYTVSTDVDPSQENQVLVRAKAVGDAACRVTERGDEPAAARCAALATMLLYHAKLVAPSIQDPECQSILITSCKDFSTHLKSFPASRPDLASELAALQKVLEDLQRDIADGKLVKRKEQLVIEDTPFRRLTEQIIEHAKQNAESTERNADDRRAMAAFANRLSAALTALDLANARCKNAPHDMKRHAAMEDAVYQVQELVLQERPGASRGAVIDLADYLSAVSSDAARLQQVASTPQLAGGAAARTASAVCAHAQAVRAAAARSRDVDGDVDYAVQICCECAGGVQRITTAIECCAAGADRSALQAAARPLREDCALLQFAAQSASATAQCAGLDEAISDLVELETRIDDMTQPSEAGRRRSGQGVSAPQWAARAQLAAAAARCPRRAPQLAPALARYAAGLRAHSDVASEERRQRLVDHLKRLQEHLKLLTMDAGRHLQTWRKPVHGVAIDQLLQELDRMEEVIGVKLEDGARIASEDYRKLLLPVRTYAVEGDDKKLEAKLESSATKLNSMNETITLSVGKPESLARTAHLTSESAVQLAAIARTMKTDEDPARNSRIEEASEELCFVTYNLLKTAELVSQDPSSFGSRRRLRDACRALTDAINRLVRTSSNGDKLHRECSELSRALPPQPHPHPACPLSYADCVAAVRSQHDTIQILTSEKPMSREEFSTSLQVLASAVSANVECAEHCAYLVAIAGQHPDLAKLGVADVARARGLAAAAQDTCLRVTRSGIVQQAKEESSMLSKQLLDLRQAVAECAAKAKEPAKQLLLEGSGNVDVAAEKLLYILNSQDVSADKVTAPAFATVEALSALDDVTQHPAVMPQPPSAANEHVDEVIDRSKELVSRAAALLRAVRAADSQQPMTWVLFNSYSRGVVEASDQLIACLKTHGQNAGILEIAAAEAEEETDAAFKSYVQTQVTIANKWLSKPTFKPQIKTDGEVAAGNVIDIGKKMATHLKDADADEMRHLSEECEQLLARCRDKYDQETAGLLMDRLKDLAKAVDRCIVNMVVEDLIEEEEPLQDLETLVDAEQDEAKRKYVLERKIKDLLAHLARVTKTARALGDGQGGARELARCSDQASLLAPMLVKAAEKRVIFPTEKALVEEYRTQLAQYSESLSRVRDLCDRAVDPMQFVQTAEEKMQRLKEESASHQDDLQKYSNTSAAIRKLANRVIHVSMSSAPAQRDPELMRALAAAQLRLQHVRPRASRLPDWHDSIAEILRATGEVESVLGGEMIFNKLPEPSQPIYNAARDLHAAVREWSARDNELVSEAKRMAVLMAKLSDYMHADKKREVISTSKAIVAASHEVARLARKLALECTDERIRTNLLHLCDQILTISAQLKMLSNVKKSSFGHQGSEEDIEAMNMLVGNAQNLMSTIQKTVSAANGASVKIRSQRGGPRIRWVRKNYQPDAKSPVLTF